ncbi:MAG TPA: tRNA lysidine(34) synthetase TilS [Planctomycetota bacterium]|nr:tRNA lysidine(34) synthetase TilS [Planctomycetota bacterium]
MALGSFPGRILAVLRARGWAEPGARWLAATSGGPDSTALAAALAELVAAGELRAELVLAHFDHAIRPDSARDAEWVGGLARRLGAGFVVERGDVPALASRDGLGIEEAARNARLAFLERAAANCGARFVATGHTADDQAETVLFRIMRGAGVRGMAGIPSERPISPARPEVLLVRPMLETTRREVLAYLAERKLDYLTDPTNRDTANQARARIRHETLPALEERLREVGGWGLEVGGLRANSSPPPTPNPQPATARSALLSLAANAAKLQSILARVAGRCLEGAEIAPGEARLPLWLLGLPPVLRTEVFAQAAERLGAPRPVPSRGLARMAEVLRKTAVGARAEARGLVAERGYDGVVLRTRRSAFGFRLSERQRAATLGWSVPVAVPGETPLPCGMLSAKVVYSKAFDLASFIKAKAPLAEVFDARLLEALLLRKPNAESRKPTLVCRSRRPGDRFRPFGSAGEKKLKAFLIDRKLPRRERDGLPLLVVGGGRLVVGGQETNVPRSPVPDPPPPTSHPQPPTVLWVVGVRLSEHARVPPDAERLVVMEYVPDVNAEG